MGFFDVLAGWREQYGEHIAVEETDGLTVTYGEMADEMLSCTAFYRNMEYDRIAVLGAPSFAWFGNAYSVLCAGKTLIAPDALLPVEDMVTLLKYADTQIVYTDEPDRKLAKALEQADIRYEAYPQNIPRQQIYDTGNDDGQIMFFTSGTSGRAKGVVVPFGALYANAFKVRKWLAQGHEGKVYLPMPTGHLYANFIALAFWNQGRTLCLGNPRYLAEDIAYFKPKVLSIVSSMAEYLLQNEEQGANTEVITVAGSKCERSLEKQAQECGIFIQNLYGASETAGAAAINRIGDHVDHLTAVEGVKLMQEDGELVISNPDRMSEYYKRPQETARVLRGDCIWLGDQVQLHEDGTWDILGRRQDMISMKNGNKLYYNEMDEELSGLAHVIEACTLYTEDRIVAVIVAQEEDRAQLQKDIKAFNKKQPYYRKLEDIWFRREALPRTSMGKLLRRNIEAEYRNRKELEV